MVVVYTLSVNEVAQSNKLLLEFHEWLSTVLKNSIAMQN
jgi:hypothetical protein